MRTFRQPLSDQLKALDEKISSTQRARDICQEMLDDQVSYNTLDTAAYFEKLSAKTTTNVPNVTTTYHEPAAVEPYHPIRCFAARMTDYLLIRCLLQFLFIVVLRIRPYGDFLSNVISYGTPFLAVLVSGLFLSSCGTTPGKWLMGIEVRDCSGIKMSLSDAMDREFNVLRYGYGFGIPIWTWIRMYKSFKAYGNEPLEWDSNSEYICHPWKKSRKTAFFGAIIAIIFLLFVNSTDILKPTYRGDLTISEFSENYNDYLKTLIDEPASTAYLKNDGTWVKETEGAGNVVVVVGSKSEGNNLNYETEGETITKITWDETWTDVSVCNPLGAKPQLAAITMIMAQNSADYFSLKDFEEQWEQLCDEKIGRITCENVEISWSIETVNCSSTSVGYIVNNGNLESSITLHFEIIVH